MKTLAEREALNRIKARLAELVGQPVGDVEIRWQQRVSDQKAVNAIIVAGNLRFVVEWQASGNTAAVTKAIHSLRQAVKASQVDVIPVFATRFLGSAGQALCDEANVSWIDLSGNARLIAPGLRIIVEGKPNQFKRPGRPRSLFAPKSSRIARHLLINHDRSMTQRELAKATDMDEGFTSRIVRQLIEQDLVARGPEGELSLANYDTMLDAWSESYDFTKHHIVRVHVAARSGEQTLHRVADNLEQSSLTWATTGLSGAWLVNPFASFRLTTFFVSQIPDSLEAMGMREESRGENVWLVVPNDHGVFDGAADFGGIRCVHPVQLYVDLKGHPERSTEAADDLRARLLVGNTDGN
ncbi:hypothetical protein LOC67_16140 [Stieleria sp. JC731]|uniref:MarR family transcriptional regulator n=1 Tax=Pirellulaceae TaxID=2691357 RepID=UPI001E430AA9|nr:MarR family transcriptional regulator [Stieleria sp. JC731]MCC9602092.1 hypothetical protein [Stieleria sp. JC731]